MKTISPSIESLKPVLEANLDLLREKYGLKSLGVFGSYVRGEQKRNSDLDLLVEFEKPIGLFKFLEMEEYLSDLLKVKVDLVSKKALKPRIGKRILEETVFL
jgi:uncharacterized protein